MIFAAGLGTRFKPWTDTHPKALAVVNGKTLLQRNIQYLQRYGIYEVVVNVHHFAEQVIEALETNEGWGSKIIVSDETAELLETGGGLVKAAKYLGEGSFVLMNADVLTDLDLGAMIVAHTKLMPLATLAMSRRETSRYFIFDHFNVLCGWTNVKTGQEKIVRTAADKVYRAFNGIHVIDPRIFSLIRRQGKFSMVDVYLDLAAGEIIRAYDHSGGKFVDVGKPESIDQAEALFE